MKIKAFKIISELIIYFIWVAFFFIVAKSLVLALVLPAILLGLRKLINYELDKVVLKEKK